MQRRIYLIDDLPPETVAVTFAKTSRSPEPFHVIAEGLTDKKSAKFHEKWVVGYGHSSVAEHAVLHIAFEDISIIAAKAIEDNRLSSFTEKSTRYQIYDPERFHTPAPIRESSLHDIYVSTMQQIMQHYMEGMDRAVAWHRENLPRKENEKDRAFANRCRTASCDVLRFFLPAGTLTNLGWTANARVLEHAISKLLSSKVSELQEIGEEIKQRAQAVVPTLVKYAEPSEYRLSCRLDAKDLPHALPEERAAGMDAKSENTIRLVEYDPEAEDKVVAALTYEFSSAPYEQILAWVRGLSTKQKERLLSKELGTPRSFDAGPRALETTTYTFEITIDYGAWRDIQRHRLCTQLAQSFTPELGYVEPEAIQQIELTELYRKSRGHSAALYSQLHGVFPDEAAYALLLGFRTRTLFIMNLREAYHFSRLRSSPHGHPSYRHIAIALWEQICHTHPLLAKYLPGVHPRSAT